MAARLIQGEDIFYSETSFIQDVIESCNKWKDRVFLVDAISRKQVTFQQLLDDMGSFSSAIRRLGQSGKIVAFFSDSCAEALTAMFGVWTSGAASAAFNPDLPLEEMVTLLKISLSEVIFCGQNSREKVHAAAKRLDWSTTIICPGGGEDTIDYFSCLQEDSQAGLQLEGWWTGPDHRLAILFTSGTTGVPKGVIIRDDMFKFCNASINFWDQKTRLMLNTPIYWGSNPVMISAAVTAGSEVVLASRMTSKELLKTIKEYKPNEWFTGPSPVLDLCKLDFDPADTSSLQILYIGGSIVLPEQRTHISKILGGQIQVRGMYGSTEASIIAHDNGLNPPSKLTSVGKPARGVAIKIVNLDAGNNQLPSTHGEVCVKSRGVLKEYLNRPLTEEELDKDGFWHLGDLGYYDEDGYLYIIARIKDIMKYRGQQIAPAELETVLLRHPDVVEACVVGKNCLEQGGDLPAAFVIKRIGSKLTEEDLQRFLADKVIDEKKLRGGVYFMDSLPKSPVGKILRRELQKKLA